MTAAPESGEACGAIPPNVGGPVPCHLPRGHGGQHFSTSGCKGSEIRWTAAPEGETDARVALTQAETKALLSVERDEDAIAAVERIVAERLRAAEGERRVKRAEALLDAWEHDAPGLVDPVFAGRLREVLRRDPAPVRLRDRDRAASIAQGDARG